MEKDIEMALDVTSANFEAEVINSDKPTVVDVWAPWCGPCKMLTPTIEQLANESEDIRFVKLNSDDNQELSAAMGVRGIPTLVLFDKGEVVASRTGVASKTQILDWVKQHTS